MPRTPRGKPIPGGRPVERKAQAGHLVLRERVQRIQHECSDGRHATTLFVRPLRQPGGEAAINAAQAKIGPDGKRLFETDAAYRAKVEKMRIEYYNSAQRAA